MTNVPPTSQPANVTQPGLSAWLLLTLLVGLSITAALTRQMHSPTTIRASEVALQLNPNTATVDELQQLPRIGPKLAANIVQYRAATTQPPTFRSVEDLTHVHRIGPITAERLRPHLRFPVDAATEDPQP